MGKTAIIYGSSTDNTKSAAERIAQKLSDKDVTLLNVSSVKANDLDNYNNLILGTSTWGLGDLQDDWEGFISKLEAANLNGKTVALFGTGDSETYPDTFVDGMGILYETIKDKGVNLVGQVSADDYSFDASRAAIDGEFMGLALDEDNESGKTDARISAWINIIKDALK